MANAAVGVLVKTSLVDFPGRVASVAFLRGCNLRCPYCYNTELVLGSDPDGAAKNDDAVTISDIIAHLEKRKNVLTGFVLSGGEPLLSPATTELISAARSMGLQIKLDTNGTCPDLLESLLADSRLKPDFVALDIKTAFSRYGILSQNQTDYRDELLKSIDLLAALPTECREFRTVLVPLLIDKTDIHEIAAFLPADAAWYFAPFRQGNCLDPSYNEIIPYTDREMADLVEAARSIIPCAALR